MILGTRKEPNDFLLAVYSNVRSARSKEKELELKHQELAIKPNSFNKTNNDLE